MSIFKRLLDPVVRSSSAERFPFLSSYDSEADGTPDTYCPYRTKDGITQQHWAIALARSFYISSCARIFCAMRSETDDDVEDPDTASLSRDSLPSIHSVMGVLYPPSHLGTSPFPDPPSYFRSDLSAPLARGNGSEVSSLSSATISVEELPLSRSRPLDPSLTGVPTPDSPFGISLFEPGPPTINPDGNIPEEPLPTYSRFDQRQPRFPVASSILGPYPPSSVIRQSAR